MTRTLAQNRFIWLLLFHNNSKINEVSIIIGIVSQPKNYQEIFTAGASTLHTVGEATDRHYLPVLVRPLQIR